MLRVGQIYKTQEDTKAFKIREGAKILSISPSPKQVSYIVIPLDRELVGNTAPSVLPAEDFSQKYPVLHQQPEQPTPAA